METALGLKSDCLQNYMRLCSSGTERRFRLIGNPSAKIRVGLVDDDFSVRRALSRLLQAHGYSCSSYDSAESALNDPDFFSDELSHC